MGCHFVKIEIKGLKKEKYLTNLNYVNQAFPSKNQK